MFELLCGTAADQAFTSGYQNSVDLGELRLEESIKRIVEGDLEGGASCAPLSHALLTRL